MQLGGGFSFAGVDLAINIAFSQYGPLLASVSAPVAVPLDPFGILWLQSVTGSLNFGAGFSTIDSIIGFVELTRAGQLIVNVTFQPMVVYPLVAVLYFALCWPLSLVALRLERRIDAALGVKQHS